MKRRKRGITARTGAVKPRKIADGRRASESGVQSYRAQAGLAFATVGAVAGWTRFRSRFCVSGFILVRGR